VGHEERLGQAWIPSALDPDRAQLGGALHHTAGAIDLRHAAGAFAVALVVHGHARAAVYLGDAHGALVDERLARIAAHQERVGGRAVAAGGVERLDPGRLGEHIAGAAHHRQQQQHPHDTGC